MSRFIRFTVLLCAFAFIAWQGLESLDITPDLSSFVAGLIAAGFTGGTLFLLEDWWSSTREPFRPQSIRLQTRETPSQISCRAVLSFVRIIFLLVALGAAIVISMNVPSS